MANRLPNTSIRAYKNSLTGLVKTHETKIISALTRIGTGTGEEIATFLGMDMHQIMRRMKKLEDEGKVFKTGEERPTKRGRDSCVYQLTGNQPKTEAENAQKEAKNQKMMKMVNGMRLNSLKLPCFPSLPATIRRIAVG